MNYLLFCLQLLIPAVSLGGIMLFFYDRFRIEAAFLPILSVSIVTLTVYLGGMLGFLWHTSMALYVIGILAAVTETVRILRKKLSVRPLLTSPGPVLFCLFCIYFIIRMRGAVSLHVDNFSHWAVIIKEMCAINAFPVSGTAVTFRNYTPGSAVFLYYVCNAVGYSEGHALMAQGILLSAALVTVFCRVRFRNVFSLIALFFVTVICVSIPELLAASLHIYNFLVDGLIAYLTVAAGIIAYAYRRDLRRCLIVLIPVTSLLSIIKSSARFFAALIVVMVVVLFTKQVFRRGAHRWSAALWSVSGISLLCAAQWLFPSLWNRYVIHAFPGQALSDNKFPSGFGALLSVFSEKEPAYLKEIAAKMCKELTDWTSPSVRILLVAECFAVLMLLLCLLLREKPKLIGAVFAAANLTGIFYMAELYILYAYIFDETEATILASFYRYFSTGAALITLALFTGGIYQAKRFSLRSQKALAATLSAAAIAAGLYTARDNAVQLLQPLYREETAQRLSQRESAMRVFEPVAAVVPPDSTVVFYTENTSFLTTCLPQYELLTRHYSMLYPQSFSDPAYIRELVGRSEYILADGDLLAFCESMRLAGYSLPDNADAVLYRITHANGADALTPVACPTP